MKKVIIAVWAFFLILSVAIIALQVTVLKPKHVHIHAGFQVYKDSKLQDFSDFKYMHEMPCTVNGKPVEGQKDEQMEKAHLHDRTGDVVHVHRDNAKWRDLFTNIKYSIDEKNLTAYINGKVTINFLDQRIGPYQSVVIFLGKNDNEKDLLKKVVKKDRIQQVERKSENCAS